MPHIPFYKYQGLGNDFIFFDGDALGYFDPIRPRAVQRLCDRRFGIGADGIILVAPPTGAGVVRMKYYNADGSFSETCFNGLRCTALHAARAGLAGRGKEFIVESPTGDVMAFVPFEKDDVSIELAGPTFDPALTPVRSEKPLIDAAVEIAGMPLIGTALSIGNPHFVVWQGEGDLAALGRQTRLIGAAVEKADLFPNATNFELAVAHSREEVLMAVWERGVGPTLACGSGATATVCAGVRTGRLRAGTPVRVTMAGGTLSISVAEDFSRVTVRGGASFVFDGFIPEGFVLEL